MATGRKSAAAPGCLSSDTRSLVETAALGLPLLAATVARTKAGITVTDADRRYLYANPAACEMLGYPLEHLRGCDLLESFPVREHPTMLAHLPCQHDDGGALFTCIMLRADGAEREIVYSTFAVDVAETLYSVGILRDHTDTREASRTAVALAQTAAQLAGTASTNDILAGIARHAVEGTRALVCGIPVVDANQEIATVGSHFSPRCGPSAINAEARNAAWNAFAGFSGEAVVHAMTAGSITIGQVPGKPVVLSDARSVWEVDPVMQGFAGSMENIPWQAGVFVPLSSGDRVFGS